MAVDNVLLADEIAVGIGQVPPATDELIGFACGVLDELTIAGTAGYNGVPSGWMITGMVGSSMATRVATKVYKGIVTPQLLAYCGAIVSHIQTAAIVTYTGPGPFPIDLHYFLGGTISGMTGSIMAELAKTALGQTFVSKELLGKCNAIVAHIHANAEVESGVIS